MNQEDKVAQQASTDTNAMNALIEKHECFILRCASTAAHRYITKSDDEWSIALIAFSQAVKTFDSGKGGFLHFAELVIKRKLTDFFRTQSRHSLEIPVNPGIFDSETDSIDENANLHLEVIRTTSYSEDNPIKAEIDAACQIFSAFGFTFFDLAKCSPKSKKTKQACAEAVCFLIKNPSLLTEMYLKKSLPIRTIERNTDVPRKTLERHRRYIIAAVEILSGEYPYLADYMHIIREELNK